MVQILPQKTNLGSQIGQALGSGLQSGMQQGLQRGMLQQALGKVRDLAAPKFDESGNPISPNPLDALTSLMEAGAGIPGSERYIGALAPILLGQIRTEQLYGNNQKGGMPATPGGTPQGPSRQMTPAEAHEEAAKFVRGNKPAGYFEAPMTPEQMRQQAAYYAKVMNDPNAYDQGLAQAYKDNEQRLQSRARFQQAAESQGITPQEMPRLMQSATEFQDLEDPAAIERAAIDKTLQIRNQKDALAEINAPGIYQNLGGLKQHFIPGMTIYKALSSKGAERQKYLKGYDELVKNLVKEGEEPYVRKTLTDMGLSPTEVEERIHPLTDEKLQTIKKLPNAKRSTEKIRNKDLIDFFKTNVDNNTSLSVLRHYLMEEKGFDWQEIQKAVQQAFPNADNLTRYQIAEISTLAQPPIPSLSQLFGPTPNFKGYLRGQR